MRESFASRSWSYLLISSLVLPLLFLPSICCFGGIWERRIWAPLVFLLCIHCIVLSSPVRLVRVRARVLVTLGGWPPRRFVGGDRGDLFMEDCEVVVELAISGVEEKLTIRKRPLLRVKGLEKKVSLRGIRCLRGKPAPLQRWLPFFVEGNIGKHLRLRVPLLFLDPSLFSCDSLRAWSYIYLVYHLWYISCAHLV